MKIFHQTNIPKAFIQSAIVATLASTAGYLIGPIEVRYIQTLTDNGFLIGLSYAVGTVVFALLSIWLGRHSDRIGRRNYIIIGLALGVILIRAPIFGQFLLF